MSISRRLLFSGLVAIVPLVAGLSSADWRGQSIYQVITDRFARTDGSLSATCDLNEYCGGTWQGLINRLDYIQNMGFTAVWISPVVKNPIGSTADGNSYHGYWAQDVTALNPKFGAVSDLKALSAELHQRGMYLMVDVVPNHMGSYSSQANVDYSQLKPFNDRKYYHNPCYIDYNNDTSIKNCWAGDDTVALPDLRNEDSAVQNMWNDWISQLVSDYSIDGLRIDTAYQINQGFWPGFQAAANGIHTLGEIWHGDPNVMCPYQNYLYGLLNYGTYYWITQAFQSTSGSISNLVNGIKQMKSTCKDVTLLGSFIENHDNPRFASLTNDMSLARSAITFQMLADGIPIIYQGQEQHFSGSGVPANRETLWSSGYNEDADLYRHIADVNRIRRHAVSKKDGYVTINALPIYSDSKTIVMRKGQTGNQIVSAYTNSGSNAQPATITIKGSDSGFPSQEGITNILTCTTLTTDSRGNLGVTFTQGKPQVLYPTAALSGSGLCGK